MGFFLTQTLSKSKFFCPTILLLLLLLLVLVSPSSSSSSSLHDQAGQAETAGPVDVPDRYHGVFFIKNTSPFFLDRRRGGPIDIGSKKMRKKTTMKTATTTTMTTRKKNKKTETNRPNFSAMLPKGFVPPSGSSPCHNENPNSVVFFCEFVTSSKP